MDSIELQAVLKLVSLHFGLMLLALVIAYRFLPKLFWRIFLGLALVAWGWSIGALTTFLANTEGFFRWFFDPSAEHNFTAILTSSLLALIGLTGFLLLWQSRKHQALWQRIYWLLLGLLFSFLALDEYSSIHESIIFWRQGYALLGGAVVILSFVMWKVRADSRPFVTVFILGLGTLGLAGVFIDAFSNEHILDIGSINFPSCQSQIFAIQCRDFANTEEFMEVLGASAMLTSLVSIASLWREQTEKRFVYLLWAGLGASWFFILIGWLWIFPFFESYFFAEKVQIAYGDFDILAYQLDDAHIAPNDTINVTLYTRTRRFTDVNYSLGLHLYSQSVASLGQSDMLLGEFEYPSRAWLPYVPVRNRFTLQIPPDLPSNASYYLVAIVYVDDPFNSLTVQATDRFTLIEGRAVALQGLSAPATNNPTPPSNHPTYHFAEGFSLVGYQAPEQVTVGQIAPFGFWWQAEQDLASDLSQFLHWFNVETDEFFTFDRRPFDGNFPTRDWIATMQVYDTWAVQLPEDLAAGRYRLQTGMYDIYTVQRMPVSDSAGQAIPDASIILGEIIVSED